MSDRIVTLASQGLADPASLKPQEIREVCAAYLTQGQPEVPAVVATDSPSPGGPGFVIDP